MKTNTSLRIIAFFLATLMLSECAMIIPTNSKVKFKNVDKNTTVSTIGLKYKATDLPDEKFNNVGKGECVGKLNNKRAIAVIQAEQEGYKTKNFIMYKTKINPLFFIDLPLGIVFLGLPLLECVGKYHKKFANEFELSPLVKIPSKKKDESFLLVNNIAIKMEKEDFTVSTVTKPEYLINHKPFVSTSKAGTEMEAVDYDNSNLVENANKYLSQWGYSNTNKDSKNVLILEGKVKKMEFMFYQGFVSVFMMCEWTVTNGISGNQIIKKDIISKSNYYKLFTAGYTKKSAVFDKTLDKSVDDVFETSLIDLLNDADYTKASSQLNEMVETVNTSAAVEISNSVNKAATLVEANNAVALIKCDDNFSSATLIGDGYAITALDLLTSPAKKKEIWLEDGSKSDFEVIQTNPKFNLALIKIKNSNTSGKVINIREYSNKELGDEIFLVSKNINATKMNNSTIKGMIASKYTKDDVEQYQIDISYNKWNDGSPVLDKDGKVIGIVISEIGGEKNNTATLISLSSLNKVFNITLK